LLSYRQILVMAGPVRRRRLWTVGRLGDDLDPVGECHTENEFWQLVVTVETATPFLCALDQFEDHRERGPVRQTALRPDGAVPQCGEGAYDWVGRPQVFPVLYASAEGRLAE
jgi:hypothetical protein